jgi:DNA-binding CsgD family transcriptional regulator
MSSGTPVLIRLWSASGLMAGRSVAHLRRGRSAAQAPGASALSAPDLRLLPMLFTHLSFPEIAADLLLSPHTVKSQAMSVYRKLGSPRGARQ